VRNQMSSTSCWYLASLSPLLVVVFLAGVSTYLPAQSLTSELTGLIDDSSDAAVVGATVLVSTRVDISTKTNEAGFYRVSNLVPGPYRVGASAPGFKKFERKGFPWSSSVLVSEMSTTCMPRPERFSRGGRALVEKSRRSRSRFQEIVEYSLGLV
jgi:hypothetical protein